MKAVDRVAIVGAAESDEIGHVPHKTPWMLHAEAARNALDDAGLAPKDVDALFSAGLGWASSMQMAEYLGIIPTFTNSTEIGGAVYPLFVEHAVAAIRSGLARVVLVTHGEQGRSRRHLPRPSATVDPSSPRGQFETPYGVGLPPSAYALAATRHMAEFGTTPEDLAEIAVATRKWARLNPKALLRDELTIQDVLNSPWVVEPFHVLDCCLVTDAGGALVITSADVARDTRKRPVWVLGTGESHTHNSIIGMPDLTWTAARISGRLAFERAGLRQEDIDVCQVYDSFTFTVLVSLESLGFCGIGEGGAFVRGQRTAPGGPFPLNTSGGGLSYTHPGMFGVFLLIEAVRQLRGECGERQVSGARTALCHGTGGFLSSAATVILGGD